MDFENNCTNANKGKPAKAWTQPSADVKFMQISVGVLQILTKISDRPTYT